MEVNGKRSDFLEVTCGVPQGSILGPQLFLIYINDMYSSLNCRLSLYADDSALFFSHKDPTAIANRLSMELSSCKKWLTDNKLSLHIGKTECLLFGTNKRLGKVGNFQITCDGVAVKQVTTVKYLGVDLDVNASGRVHANTLINKCVGRVCFLYRNSAMLDINCRRILCAALIQPYLDYCCASWYSGLTKELKGRLDVLQRRMVRFVFSKGPRHHVDSNDLRDLSWLQVGDRVDYFKLMHVFKIRRGLAPMYLSRNFVPVSATHMYNTRHSGFNYAISKQLTGSLTSFSFTAVKLWNALPATLKEIDSEASFRKKLKGHLMRNY